VLEFDAARCQLIQSHRLQPALQAMQDAQHAVMLAVIDGLLQLVFFHRPALPESLPHYPFKRIDRRRLHCRHRWRRRRADQA
jgi:hypothetical protein